MKPDSVVNLAALAALCGTAGVAGFYNQHRKRERDAEKVREILDNLKEQEDFNKEAAVRMLIKQASIKKEAANPSVLASLLLAQLAKNTKKGTSFLLGKAKSVAGGVRNASGNALSKLRDLLNPGVNKVRDLFSPGIDKVRSGARKAGEGLQGFAARSAQKSDARWGKLTRNLREDLATRLRGDHPLMSQAGLDASNKANEIVNKWHNPINILRAPGRGARSFIDMVGKRIAGLGA